MRVRKRLAVTAVSAAAITVLGGIAGAEGPDAPLPTEPDVAAAAAGIEAALLLGEQPVVARSVAVPERSNRSAETPVVRTWDGVASWYGPGFAGRRTANGEVFDPGALTAAHRTLPFGSEVRVTNPRTGRSVVVRINDRGPFVRGREIDLARAAAAAIGMVSAGHARVHLELLRP